MNGARPIRRPLAGVATLVLFLALAVLFLRPPLGELDTRIASDRGDPVFNLYLMQWGAHELELGMPAFWHAPIFHPTRWATTFSDHMLLPAALCALGARLGAPPVAVYDALVLLSFALCGWGCTLVLRRSGIGFAAAVVGGCLFAFAPYRFQQVPHLQILLACWIPPTLWTFDRLLAAPGVGRAAAFLAFYALHVLGGNYLAYMIHLPLAALLVSRLADGASRAAMRSRIGLLASVAVLCAGLLGGIFWPYLAAGRQLGLRRTPGEMLAYGGSLLSYADSPRSWSSVLLPRALHRDENGLFAGFVGTALAISGALGAAAAIRRPLTPGPTPRRRMLLGVALAVGLAGFALGEAMVWTGTAFLPLYAPALLIAGGAAAWVMLHRDRGSPAPLDWRRLDPWDRGLLAGGAACLLASLGYVFVAAAAVVPGLSSMRVSTRFYPFVSFAIAGLAARAADGWLSRRRPRRAALLGGALVVLTLADLAPTRTRWPRLPETPAIYARVASDPAVAAILELPFFHDDLSNVAYLAFQTAHWKPIVNGYSGFLPPGYAALRERCDPFPGPAAIAELRGLGVTHIVAHLDLLKRWQLPLFHQWLAASGLRTVAAEGHAVLIALDAASPAEPPTRTVLDRPWGGWYVASAPL